jgi:hypothetical protein
MATKIWSSKRNPPKAVADQLKIDEYDLGDALHKLKHAAGLRGDNSVTIWSDGTVTDDNAPIDEDPRIGNIYDEV